MRTREATEKLQPTLGGHSWDEHRMYPHRGLIRGPDAAGRGPAGRVWRRGQAAAALLPYN